MVIKKMILQAFKELIEGVIINNKNPTLSYPDRTQFLL